MAEDHDQMRELLAKKLRQAGYDVETVSNGFIALGAYYKNHYDLIIMDGNMPEMDGFEATRHIRTDEQRNRKIRIPITGFTGDVDGERKCREAGMDEFVDKDVKRLLIVIRSMFTE